jgi:hypothetical protein
MPPVRRDSELAHVDGLGAIRKKIVNISDTTYLPTQEPSVLYEMLDQIVGKAVLRVSNYRTSKQGNMLRLERTRVQPTARAALLPRNHSSASNRQVEKTIRIVASAAIVGVMFSRMPVNIWRGSVV